MEYVKCERFKGLDFKTQEWRFYGLLWLFVNMRFQWFIIITSGFSPCSFSLFFLTSFQPLSLANASSIYRQEVCAKAEYVYNTTCYGLVRM